MDQKTIIEHLKTIGPEAKKTEVRSNAYKVLLALAENEPETLLPYWDDLAALLHCGNGSSQYCAVHLLAPLARVDREGRFEALLDDFFSLLEDESVMVASHTAAAAGQIALALPELQQRITRSLFGIENTRHDPEHKGLVISYAIEALDAYFVQAADAEAVVVFVRRQLNSASPKTRKLAAAFLKKWGYVSKS